MSVEWVPSRSEFPIGTDDLEKVATVLHRLSDASVLKLRSKRRKEYDEKAEKAERGSDNDEDLKWYRQVLRVREAAERFVRQVLEENGLKKSRLTRTERKRRAREAIATISGIDADRDATAKRRKAATDSLSSATTKPSSSPTSPTVSSTSTTASTTASTSANVRFTNWNKTKASASATASVTVDDVKNDENEGDGSDGKGGDDKGEDEDRWVKGKCYICREAYRESERHGFYPRMCVPCGDLNLRKRAQTADLRGRYAVVTGGRVKIGFEIALRLLRAGCHVIVTTRLPNDALKRFAAERDFESFRSRLEFEGIDLRFTADVLALCDKLKKRLPRLDILINNAAQTIRRPPKYYQHLIPDETKQPHLLLPNLFPNTNTTPLPLAELANGKDKKTELAQEKAELTQEKDALVVVANTIPSQLVEVGKYGDLGRSAMQTQIVLVAEDHPDFYPDEMFPAGQLDAHQQQVDLRPRNSWIARPEEITPVELAETQVVNAIAPFLLFTNLLPLLRKAAQAPDYAFVVMVTAEEGTFNRHRKDSTHVHTNMAKAAMNQITRSCAERYAKNDRVLINSVDTGWVDDMTPVGMPNRRAFRPPLADPDGAARVLDPIFVWFRQGIAHYGVRFKDYAPSAW